MKNSLLPFAFIIGTILFGIGAENKILVLILIGLVIMSFSVAVLVFNPKIKIGS